MTSSVHISRALNEFLSWNQEVNHYLGTGQGYTEVAGRVFEATKFLPRREITIHFHYFDYDFTFCYGEQAGKKELIPISMQEREILVWQRNLGTVTWALQDPTSKEYFIPKFTENTIGALGDHKWTMDYVNTLYRKASEDRDSREWNILKVLEPYSFVLHQAGGINFERKWRKLITQ